MVQVKEVGAFAPKNGDGLPFRIWMVGWNHDGSLLASCGEDKAVRIWKHFKDEDNKLECRSVLDDSHSRAVRYVSFSHCGKFLASASFDSCIVIYQSKDGDFIEVNKLEGHESEVKCCTFSASDEFLATCSRDKSVWFWQMDEDEDFQVSSILQSHTQDVKFVKWHPTADLLVSCSYDYSIVFYRYDGEDWIRQQSIKDAHNGTVWCCDFDADGDRLVTIGEDRVVQIWHRKRISEDVTKDEWISACSYKIEDGRWPLYSVSWNKTTGLIAVGSGDTTIRILSLSDGPDGVINPEATIENGGSDINCVAWCPSDVNLLASCSDDGFIRLHEIEL